MLRQILRPYGRSLRGRFFRCSVSRNIDFIPGQQFFKRLSERAELVKFFQLYNSEMITVGDIVNRFSGQQRQGTGTPLKQRPVHLCGFIGCGYHDGREDRGKGEQHLDGDIECHKMPVQRIQARPRIRRKLLPMVRYHIYSHCVFSHEKNAVICQPGDG